MAGRNRSAVPGSSDGYDRGRLVAFEIIQEDAFLTGVFFCFQDRVLAITNQIMDELLGEDRAARAFRAKFPEEVLQESLAGQLWFGAECLAAGSSIMNREVESATMRPLAKAVTKSLDNVRNLLREQCLRNNTPNSLTLRLDVNDAATEQLYESLKIFDRLFAEFELLYVSAMVQVKSKQEYEMQELICVLFSETLQRALKVGLLEQEQVDSYDPALMFSIPRLAIVAGLVIFKEGPLNMDQPADDISEMFRPFRKLLIKMRDLLRTLTKHELYQLEKLLCTNEEISLKEQQIICDGNEIVGGGQSPSAAPNPARDDTVVIVTTSATVNSSDNLRGQEPEEEISSFYTSNNRRTVDSEPNEDDDVSESNDEDEEEEEVDEDDPANILKDALVTSDCASGYLIPNTNFGNLLQTNEAPLTDSFIATDEELKLASGAASSHARIEQILSESNQKLTDSGLGTANPSLDHSPELETERPVTSSHPIAQSSSSSSEEEGEVDEYDDEEEDSESTLCEPKSHHTKHQHGRRHRHHHHRKHYSKHRSSAAGSAGTSGTTPGEGQISSCDTSPSSGGHPSECASSTSGGSSSSGASGDADAAQEVAMAIRAAGRIKFK